MKKFIGKFHYLTQDLRNCTHASQAQKACEAGANWIQYRCFSKADDEMMKDLNEIITICDDWGTTLIVTEHFRLFAYADIQGVHIENEDIDLQLVRNCIGNNKTLGASANNIKQIISHQKNSADYVGCGPFAHTNTKPNQYTHWGFDGYKKTIEELNKIQIEIPLIAAGGIKLNNVSDLLKTGIWGVAVSEEINKAKDIKQAYKAFYNAIY